MPGLVHITLIALVASCDAFRLGLSQRDIPLSPAADHLFQDESPALPLFIQELVRTKRNSVHELVRAQPHLVHDMGWPEIHEISRSQAQTNSSQLNPSSSLNQDVARTEPAVDENLDVEDEMERMVHLVTPQDAERYRGQPDATDPETELLSGPGAGDTSQEASGFYGTDMEDRDRGEEGGEDRERRGGEDEWEREEDRERRGGDARREEEEKEWKRGMYNQDVLEANRTTPDLDALIGYSPSFHPSSSKEPSSISSPAEVQVGPIERELWEAEGEEDAQSSGYGVLHSSITTVRTTSTATAASSSTAADGGGDAVGTATPEKNIGIDFGLLENCTKVAAHETEDEDRRREEEEEEAGLTHRGVFSQNPTVPEVGMAPSREPLQPSVEEDEERQEHDLKGGAVEEKGAEVTTPPLGHRSEVSGSGVTEVVFPVSDVDELQEAQQVVCVDWSELAGRGYVILNMTQNLNCEEFRVDQGVRLLKIMEQVFARRMNSPEGSWVIYLSKPTHQQHQLLMNVASEQGVIPTKEVLVMLGQIRKSLNKVGIQNYSAASSCQSRPSQTRSDYGKLFVVLVIIGSVCMVIITSGFIYICWQRRLPATKTTFRAEELHFVENGCHDNPMLDVTNDAQPEMQEKKPSTNGLAGGGGEGGKEDGSRWQVFVNQAATEEEEEEQDTHL